MTASTLQSLVDSLTEQGDKTALLALTKKGTQRWCYRELGDRARSFATGLKNAGFKPGDSVALFAENRPEWIAAALGVIRLGAVAVPLDVQLADHDLAHVLNDSDARAIITTQQRAKRLATLSPRPNARLILLDATSEDERSWERLLNQDAAELPAASADDVAVLFYTSGTTGPPKGVPLSHGNIGSQLEMVKELHVVTEEDRVLLPLPLHHVYPFVLGMLAPLLLTLPIILPFSLTGPQLLRALSEGEATAMVGVPRLYSAFYSGIIGKIESSGRIVRRVFNALLALSGFAQTWLRLRIGKTIFHSLHKRFGKRACFARAVRCFARSCGCDGTTRTEHGACRTTFSAVLPINACLNPVRPCVAVMITSTRRRSANVQISHTGGPTVIAVSNFTPPNFAARRNSRICPSAASRAASCKAERSYLAKPSAVSA